LSARLVKTSAYFDGKIAEQSTAVGRDVCGAANAGRSVSPAGSSPVRTSCESSPDERTGVGVSQWVPWALHVDEQISPQKMIVTGPDGYAILQVADGSTIEVFPNSKFAFRETPTDWKTFCI